jgi:predicted amidohydrolase
MLRVTVLELPARWGEPAAALADVDAILSAGPATDLVVLPEQSLSGYVSPDGDFDLTPFAEPLEGPTPYAASRLAARHGVHLLAPLVLRERGTLSNAVVLFDPSGERVFVYRKRHPWFPETWATPGEERPPVVTVAGVKVTVAVCYDVHFLAEDSAAELTEADLLLFPSAWVDDHDTREMLLRDCSRAFELAIASANWGPSAIRMKGQGGSCVIDAGAKTVARVKHGQLRADASLSLPRRAG